jgi:hypothetical protein
MGHPWVDVNSARIPDSIFDDSDSGVERLMLAAVSPTEISSVRPVMDDEPLAKHPSNVTVPRPVRVLADSGCAHILATKSSLKAHQLRELMP